MDSHQDINKHDTIYDSKFSVSNYMDDHGHTLDNINGIYNGNKSNEDIARNWSLKTSKTIILPTKDLDELELQWNNFNGMIKKNRRESDWISLELFGKNNQERYEEFKDQLLNKDIFEAIRDGEIPYIADGDTPIVSESYVDAADSYYDPDAINYTAEDVEKAIAWGKESDRFIIIPTRTLNELEELWDAYNSMIKKHRRESDWMSQELFGLTNLKHYEYLKNQFLKENIDEDKDYNMYIENVSTSDIGKYLKSVALNESLFDFTESALKLTQPNKSIYEELLVNNIISGVTDEYDKLISINPAVDMVSGDIPYIDANDMIDMGVFGQSPIDNYFGSVADNTMINETISVKEWFEMYRAFCDGFYTEMGSISSDWVNKVRTLSFGLARMIENCQPEEKINARKQSLLELGWNPDIPFTDKARLVARENAIEKYSRMYETSRVVDLTGFRTDGYENVMFTESNSASDLKPVFVVLTEGKTPIFSDVVRKFTNDIYTHASISFDYTLQKMYSFGTISGKSGGGFREENVKKNTPKGCKVGVYVFFLPVYLFEKMTAFVQNFIDNKTNTRYSYKNLFTYAFNIPYNKEWKLICSQFVDKCLKFAGVNATNVDSSLVAPKTLHTAMHKKKKIYCVFEDLAEKYDASKIKKLLDSLVKKAKPIKEGSYNFLESEKSYVNSIVANCNNPVALMNLKEYSNIVTNPKLKSLIEDVLFESLEIQPYCEAKSFPVQFDADGNLFIKNLKKINYEEEYAKSHKLLKQYDSHDNLDGMKYELSKLWMMNCMIEQEIYTKKNSDIEKSMKARAKILNDFKYYLEKVLQLDPKFNFTAYFEDSPFSSTTKIDATTISYLGKMIRTFMKSL